MIYADEMIISHTNETEYQRFVGNKKIEAPHDPMILIWVPYNLTARDEVHKRDKWSDADNRCTVDSLQGILPRVNVFGYGEVREGGYTSTLMPVFSKIKHPRTGLVGSAQPTS